MSLTITASGSALVPQGLDQACRMADMMARARTLPSHLQNNPGDCLMVVEQAMRWGMSPFAVAQCTSVIQGKLMFEGKLVAAALHSSGALTTRMQYDYSGEGDTREIKVSATLAGETAPRSVVVKYKDAKTSNGMWTKQPDQQLAYHGVRVWARRFAPEVMLGVYAPEEIEAEPRPAPPPHAGPTIDGKAEPPPPSHGTTARDAINAAVPMSATPPPASAPTKRTIGQILEALAIDLGAAQNAADYELIVARDDVQKLMGFVTNGARDKLTDMLAATRQRCGALAPHERIPGLDDDADAPALMET